MSTNDGPSGAKTATKGTIAVQLTLLRQKHALNDPALQREILEADGDPRQPTFQEKLSEHQRQPLVATGIADRCQLGRS